MRRIVLNAARVVFLLALLGLAFAAGVTVAPKVRPAQDATGMVRSGGTAPADAAQEVALFWEAWRLLEREYYGEPIDSHELVVGAISGMVASLDDAYSLYLSADDVALAQSELDGTAQSVGLAVEKRNGQLVVIAPLAGSPAQRAGISAGDHIVSINGRDAAGLSLAEAVNLMRGPSGSRVALTIVREPATVLSLDVTRGDLTVPFASARVLPDGILYVNISLFDSNVSRDVITILRQADAERLRGIVLDLRNNPGGLLDAAVEVAGQFVADGVIVSQVARTGSYVWSYEAGKQLVVSGPEGRRATPVRTRPLASDTPLVVLVNRGTASAAEVLAAALQDHGRAILIGERTFGKGTISGAYTLSDGSSVQITTGRWSSPKGRHVDGQGLVPDIIMAESSVEPDTALGRAVELLMAGR